MTRRRGVSMCSGGDEFLFVKPFNAAWVTQQARQVVWTIAEQPEPTRVMIRDHDRRFTLALTTCFEERAFASSEPIPPPRANAIAERFVRTVRAGCLGWLLIVNGRHLERVLYVFMTPHDLSRSLSFRPYSCRSYCPQPGCLQAAPPGSIQRLRSGQNSPQATRSGQVRVLARTATSPRTPL